MFPGQQDQYVRRPCTRNEALGIADIYVFQKICLVTGTHFKRTRTSTEQQLEKRTLTTKLLGQFARTFKLKPRLFLAEKLGGSEKIYENLFSMFGLNCQNV